MINVEQKPYTQNIRLGPISIRFIGYQLLDNLLPAHINLYTAQTSRVTRKTVIHESLEIRLFIFRFVVGVARTLLPM